MCHRQTGEAYLNECLLDKIGHTNAVTDVMLMSVFALILQVGDLQSTSAAMHCVFADHSFRVSDKMFATSGRSPHAREEIP